MSTIKNERWRLRGVDLEIACVLDTPADSDRSPFNAAVYRAWVVGHEVLTSAYGESPVSACESAKERATGVPEPEFDPRPLLTEIARIDRETVALRALAAKTSLTHDLSTNDIRPRTLTLAEVLAGAERAAARVERWPEWKRELSPSTSSKPKG